MLKVSTSGLPRTPQTIKKILFQIFNDKEWSKMSDCQICEWVGVRRSFFDEIKAEFLAQKGE